MITLTNAPTGRTIIVEGYLRGTNTVSSAAATMPETRPGFYAYTPSSLADGAHDFVLTDGGAIVGTIEYHWRNGAEVTPGTLRDNIFTRSAHSAADVWAVATRTITDKAGFSLSAAGISAIWAETTRTLTSFGTLAADVWAATTRSLTEAVTTDSASREASKASTLGLATSLNVSDTQAAILAAGDAWGTPDLGPLTTLVSSIPTTPLLAADYTAPDNAGIGELTDLLTGDNLSFTSKALENAPTGGTGGGGLTTAQNTQLFAIPTTPLLAADYIAPDNAGIAATRTAAERLTVARAAKLDTVAVQADAALYKADLTGVALASDVDAVSTLISAIPEPDNNMLAALEARFTDSRAAKLDQNLVILSDLNNLVTKDDLVETQVAIVAATNENELSNAEGLDGLVALLESALELLRADEKIRLGAGAYAKLREGTQEILLSKQVTKVGDEITVSAISP